MDLYEFDDPGPRAQAAAEAHLEAVWEAFYEGEDHPERQVLSPASAPFCGCETCIVREILAGAWPVIEEFIQRNRSTGGQGT